MSLTQLWIDSRVNSRSDRFLLRALATAGPLTGLATMLTPAVRWVQRCQPLGDFDPKPWISAIIDIFRKVFRSHGEFCATQPWEVMIRKSRENVGDSEFVRWSWQRSPSSFASSPCGGSTVSRWRNIQSLISSHILLLSGSWSVPRHSSRMEHDGVGGDDLHQVTNQAALSSWCNSFWSSDAWLCCTATTTSRRFTVWAAASSWRSPWPTSALPWYCTGNQTNFR